MQGSEFGHPQGHPEATGSWRPAAADEAPEIGADPPTVRSGNSGSTNVRKGGPVPDPTPLPKPGESLDQFVLEDGIGVGGMGAVYRALDAQLDRYVALKILPPEQAVDPEVVQRFYQEGRAAARLDHENIARVYSIGHDAAIHYIAFEYIDGTTIRQRVDATGPLPVGEAVNFTLQIANALIHASERGVVHRDIKPSNIIVTHQGRAKLVDMGLARRFERGGDEGLTQSGMTLGTFDYISPEQARDPRDVDVRSDLYSLGCTLFHMLAGRPPFAEGTVLQKLIQHQEEPVPEIRDINPDVPSELSAILNRLMAKDRDNRFQTPEQLVRDLLIVAGSMGLRSTSPEGLIWMAPIQSPAWQRHAAWALPTAGLVACLCYLLLRPEPVIIPETQPSQAIPKVADSGAKTQAVTKLVEEPTSPRVGASLGSTLPGLPGEISVDSSQDLWASLVRAPAGSVVVLVDDGPYLLKPMPSDPDLPARLESPDLTIRAGEGVSPLIRLDHTGEPFDFAPSEAVLNVKGGRLNLEGLTIQIDGGRPEQDGQISALQAVDVDLTVRRCSFRRKGPTSPGDRSVGISLTATKRPTAEMKRPPDVEIESCHIEGASAAIHATGPVDLTMHDCTVAAVESILSAENFDQTPTAAEFRLKHVSIAAGTRPVFVFIGESPRVRLDDSVIAPSQSRDPMIDGPLVLVAADHPEQLDWRGRNNLYSKIDTYLLPSRGAGVLTFKDWLAYGPSTRESNSIARQGPDWRVGNPLETLARTDRDTTHAFQLVDVPVKLPGVGVTRGPHATAEAVASTARDATSDARNPRAGGTSQPASLKDRILAAIPTGALLPDTQPSKTVIRDNPIGDAGAKGSPSPPTVPIEPGGGVLGASEPEAGRTETTIRPDGSSRKVPPGLTPPSPRPGAIVRTDRGALAGVEPASDYPLIRTAEQFVELLGRPEARGGTVMIASNANLELPSTTVRASGSWKIRGEAGKTRPRFTFRPEPGDAAKGAVWPAWLHLVSGRLKLEGIDIVLPDVAADGIKRGVFSVAPGTDLTLDVCTITVEGTRGPSAVFLIHGEGPTRDAATEPEPPAATVGVSNSLIRTGGVLVDVAAGRRVDLELNNSVVGTGGPMVAGHGLPRGKPVERIKIELRQVTARAIGGLVELKGTDQDPELPTADVLARDSILATTSEGDPLFRVSGPDSLEMLRDRIKWEGHAVAYHQIRTYRIDESLKPGGQPKFYDRTGWDDAVSLSDSAPSHDKLKFTGDWDSGQPPWSLRLDDVKLAPGATMATSGPELQRIPSPPAR
ncbi:serine/threonine-protein kinase [Isosphaeraceae bacterium EP7]